MSERLRDLAHGLKSLVVGRAAVRELLRRVAVTPFQLGELRRIVRRLPPPAACDGPAVLVLALRPWAISRAWETVLSRLLLAEGCRVVWAVCDGVVGRCDAMLGERPDPGICRHCARFNRKVAAIAGVERIALADLPLPPASVPGDPGDPVDPATGVPRVAVASLQRLLGRRPRPRAAAAPAERALADELTAGVETMRRVAAPLLDRVRPDAVLALNGKFFAEAVVLAAAAGRGIPGWTYERGNRRDTLMLAPRPAAIPFDGREALARIDEPLTGAEQATIDRYLERRVEVGNGQVRFLRPAAAAPARHPSVPGRTVALFTNLIWDSAVVGEDTLFPDMFAWIEATVRELADRPGTRLVIRVHPAEERIYWHPTRERVGDVLRERFPDGLPANLELVDALDPVDSYELVRAADLVLVYASTIGMEAAAMGRRVVAASNSSFAAAPFVVHPASREEYLAELRGDRAAPPEAAGQARRFLYRLFFEGMLPVPWVREDPTGFHAGEAAPAGDAPLTRKVRAIADSCRAHARGLPAS